MELPASFRDGIVMDSGFFPPVWASRALGPRGGDQEEKHKKRRYRGASEAQLNQTVQAMVPLFLKLNRTLQGPPGYKSLSHLFLFLFVFNIYLFIWLCQVLVVVGELLSSGM